MIFNHTHLFSQINFTTCALVIFTLHIQRAQAQEDYRSPRKHGIRIGVQYNGDMGASADYFHITNWPRTRNTFGYTLGIQYLISEPDRERYIPRWLLEYNLIEKEKDFFLPIALGFAPVLSEGDATLLFKDIQEFQDQMNYIIQSELGIGYHNFSLRYQFNYVLQPGVPVIIPKHALSAVYTLRFVKRQ